VYLHAAGLKTFWNSQGLLKTWKKKKGKKDGIQTDHLYIDLPAILHRLFSMPFIMLVLTQALLVKHGLHARLVQIFVAPLPCHEKDSVLLTSVTDVGS
jgi:hypothetical protein